jgi:hypothetical protein
VVRRTTTSGCHARRVRSARSRRAPGLPPAGFRLRGSPMWWCHPG